MDSAAAGWFVDPDEPLHRVAVTGTFELATTEVTQELWRQVMGENPVQTRRVGAGDDERCAAYLGQSMVDDRAPVVCVTWCEAVRFANELAEREGLQPAYDASGCEAGQVTWDRGAKGWRLPTEAEWEYAASAGGRHRLFAGSYQDLGDRACRELFRYGNVADASFHRAFPEMKGGFTSTELQALCQGADPGEQDDEHAALAPVGSYLPNAFGLHDMTGNAREWVWDWYEPAPQGDLDPTGPGEGTERVFRGSAFDDDALNLRLTNRGHGAPDRRFIYVGLRLARSR